MHGFHRCQSPANLDIHEKGRPFIPREIYDVEPYGRDAPNEGLILALPRKYFAKVNSFFDSRARAPTKDNRSDTTALPQEALCPSLAFGLLRSSWVARTGVYNGIDLTVTTRSDCTIRGALPQPF